MPRKNIIEESDYCLKHGRSEPATHICLKCREHICTRCSRDHLDQCYDIVKIERIADKKREIEDDIEKKLRMQRESEQNLERNLRNKKEDLYRSIDEQISKCQRELTQHAEIAKRNVANYLESLSQASNLELKEIESESAYWKRNLQAKIDKYRGNDRSQEGLFELYKEHTSNKAIEEYSRKIRRQVDIFESEINKISLKIFPKLQDFSKNQLFSDIDSLGKEKSEQKKVNFGFEGGYKPYGYQKNEIPRDPPRNQPEPYLPRNRSKSISRAKSKSDRDYEEKKQSDSLQQQLNNNQNNYYNQHNQNNYNQDDFQGLDNLIQAMQNDLNAFNIPLAVKKNNGLMLTSQAKPSIDNNAIYDLKQWLGSQQPAELQFITEVDFTCSGMDNLGTPALGDSISKLPSLTSLSLKFAKSEKMDPRDLKNLEKAFTDLKQLTQLKINFSNWRALTDNSAEIFLRDLSSLRTLKVLDLKFSGCQKVKDEGVCKIVYYVTRLDNLKTFNLSLKGCSDITDSCYSQIRKQLNTMQSLEKAEIDISECPRFLLNPRYDHEDRIKFIKR